MRRPLPPRTFVRNGHGNGAGVPRIECPPVDELPVGVASPKPAPEAMPRPPYAAGSAEAREAGRRGGAAKAGTTALGSRLGLAATFADGTFEPYRAAADNFARLHIRLLAESVGNGECGPAPSSIVQSAALQLAASRWAFEVKGDAVLGSRLANDSRQNLLAAHSLAALEGEIRAKANPGSSPLERLRREIMNGSATKETNGRDV